MARISKSELIRLQKKLKRDAAIGAEFGITRQAVHQLRRKYGIGSVIEDNPQRNRQIMKLHRAGKGVSAIARKFDLSVSYTYRIISENRAGKKRGRKRR
jgi:DNA invertase Pin-like site-specific DNA recombinase